ncbi:PREDICTED: uncharacterized protein LOC106749598 [Dinoponera quadriceps]|uniref:Uncharacterized protein LOC106749598 n=1 Tax=Dinoponera quadriceps TaxID=609295 RepID=A0A6P3Y3B6_DINQU|nr:PREDICTED: uncharacterized protein LOC106749598 [Dinoponera quadriceps]XP_014484741.1 PREDICTED: uncharacterized protein LOC106749598 [Dinoponera quadriceps]
MFGTCAKWSNARKRLRENMDSEIFFEKYTLSEESIVRLESIRKTMQDNIARANPVWRAIAGESEEKISSESEDSDNDDDAQMISSHSILEPSTQFYFSQVERIIPTADAENIAPLQKYDILESLCESLERNNGKFDFAQLESLSDEDLVSLINELAKKLSPKGIYNICQSMKDMTVEEKMKYLSILCTYLLLPKIIELEEPSRLLSSAISECVRKFPDEVQRFIFLPLLDTELKDTTLIITIINTFELEKKAVLLKEFLAFVKELKSWHIPVLQNLLSIRLDHDMIDNVIKLFLGKALYYSKDKNFGKLVLSFLKINTTLSQEQKNSMLEITIIHETLFKKPIENLLRNM